MIEDAIFEFVMRELHGTIGPAIISMDEYEKFFSGTDTGTAVLDRPSTGRNSKFDSWWTVKVEPFSCACGFQTEYAITSGKPHRIIVWPCQDDPNLVKYLATVSAEGDDFDVVEYEQAMGEAVSFYEIHPR